VFVELPKFKPQTIAEKKMMVLWLRFLTEIDRDTENVPQELLENPETSKALKILEKSAYNEKELNAYEYYWDAVYNERGAIRHGYKQGRAEGMAQGRAEGIAQGIEQTKRENALRMKADGMPDDLIAKYTGLAIDIIRHL
jgi:predicted transposase/invertase (TIGR01784 family)